jgi:metal-responsive CopG/Arc/MetJ family transcriptional regulator
MSKQTRTKDYLGISIDRDILEEIDERRGLIKRSTYVNDLLKKLVSEKDIQTAAGNRLCDDARGDKS